MPVTEAQVMTAFANLIDGGTRCADTWQGPKDIAGMRKTAAVWVRVLDKAGLDLPQLQAGIDAYLAGPKADFFPTPGAVVRLAPLGSKPITLPSRRDPSTYNDDLDDFGRQMVIDRADREGWWSLPTGDCWRRIETASRELLAHGGAW